MSVKKNSGLGARIAAQPTSSVAAGMEAALGTSKAAGPETVKEEVVAINIRLPKGLHRRLRQIAFDKETSINAMLIEAAEKIFGEA